MKSKIIDAANTVTNCSRQALRQYSPTSRKTKTHCSSRFGSVGAVQTLLHRY
jgi:hypothetical protein